MPQLIIDAKELEKTNTSLEIQPVPYIPEYVYYLLMTLLSLFLVFLWI